MLISSNLVRVRVSEKPFLSSKLSVSILTLCWLDGVRLVSSTSRLNLLVAFDQVVHYAVVEIFTTEASVTSSCQALKDTVIDRGKGKIKGTTTEIVDDDMGFTFLLRP